MKIIPIKQKLLEKENKEDPLCPNCGVELDFESNDIEEKQSKGFLSWFRDNWALTGNGWFSCPVCKEEYCVEDYADKNE